MRGDEQVAIEVAAQEASRAHRRARWLEVEELIQAASEATLKAVRAFDPRVGTPLQAYLARAASFALRKYVRRLKLPVSLGGNRALEYWPQRAELDMVPDVVEPPDLDKLRHEARVKLAVQRVLSGPGAEGARAVLLESDKPRAVAARLGTTAKAISKAAGKYKRRVMEDLECYEAWRNG